MTTQANITPNQAAAMLAAEAAPAANDNAGEVASDIAASVSPSTPASPTAGELKHKHEVHLSKNEVAELNDKPFALQLVSEQKLASFLHEHLSPILSKGLLVDVRSNLSDWSVGNAPVMMDLHIDVMGDDVHNKAEELWARTTEELKKHPAFAGLEIGGGYETTGHNGEAVSKEILENTNKLHMVVTGIPVDRFKQLLETLAEVKPAPTQHADKTDHQCSGAGCSQCAAQGTEAPAVAETSPEIAASAAEVSQAVAPTLDAKTDVVQPLAAVVPTHPAATAAAEAQASAAQAVTGTPPAAQVAGVNHQGVANDNLNERAVG